MNWEDEGYLLAKRKFRENGSIIDVFTKEKGRVSGIVYGGNSRKIRNYLQVSNKIFISYTEKNENKIGYFKTELIKPIAANYFNDKRRTSALLSLTSILKILLPESQPYKDLYSSISSIFINFNNDNWLYLYSFWEYNLIKILGYDPNLSVNKENLSKEINFIDLKIDGINYSVPSFLITKKLPIKFDNKILKKSLMFTRLVMQNKFFIPNNLSFPKSRIIFENYFS
tara:strand:+ start:4285 stop:4965 length:681 start_codon:yes stop_codon:yes gene_type:complete